MPLLGAADLEVHVAEVILVAEDVGQDGDLVAFLDEAHRDAGDRRLDRHARVHQRQRAAADRRPSTSEPFDSRISETMRIVYGNSSCVGQHARERALGEGAVTDLATAGAAHRLGLARREGREVVVQHEALPTSPVSASILCSSCAVPSVVVTIACVSPRVKSAEPCARGRTPTSHVIGRMSVVLAAVDARGRRRARSSRSVLLLAPLERLVDLGLAVRRTPRRRASALSLGRRDASQSRRSAPSCRGSPSPLRSSASASSRDLARRSPDPCRRD